ncbi:MAG TPA: 4-hydroxybenzoate octaprenyltransferase, partial [Neisseriales bacterium]|nr:4-hydroxybenzoate octaprenyltransferase [Neisseriales bacterium]
QQIKTQERDLCFKAFLYNNKLGYWIFILIVLSYWKL